MAGILRIMYLVRCFTDVLPMFYRYISENLTHYVNQGEFEAGNKDFDYAQMPDADAEEARAGLVTEKVFLFCLQNCFVMYAAELTRMSI